MGARRARRGAGDQEPGRPADARSEGRAGARPHRAHGDSGREPPRRPLVALRLPATRSAGRREGVRRRSAAHGGSRARRLPAAAPAAGSLHPAPPQDGPPHHRRPSRQDRGDGVLRVDARAGRALPARRRRPRAGPRRTRRDGAARRDPRLAGPSEADLQPPVAVPGRRRVGSGGQRQARPPARDCRGRGGPAGEDARLHPVPRDERAPGVVSRERLRRSRGSSCMDRSPSRSARVSSTRSSPSRAPRSSCSRSRRAARA